MKLLFDLMFVKAFSKHRCCKGLHFVAWTLASILPRHHKNTCGQHTRPIKEFDLVLLMNLKRDLLFPILTALSIEVIPTHNVLHAHRVRGVLNLEELLVGYF